MSEKHEQESDALTVARWRWPERQWGVSRNGEVGTLPDSGPDCHFSPTQFDSDDSGMVQVLGVRDAERVLVERGHGEQYGIELAYSIGLLSRTEISLRIQIGVKGAHIAGIAMIPPEVRVRAMAAVIRAIEATRGTPCPFTFREVQCGYSGPSASCDKSFERCRELGNAVRFGGSPIRRPT